MVTAPADGPAAADGGATVSVNDGGGNTRSDERRNASQTEDDTVRTPESPAEHGMEYALAIYCV